LKSIYAFIASGVLLLGGLFFFVQAEQLKDDAGSGWDCKMGNIGNLLGIQFRGVDSSGCAGQRSDIESASTTSNLLFVGAAGTLGFGIYLQRGKRKDKEASE
jgi:hypothetical protein